MEKESRPTKQSFLQKLRNRLRRYRTASQKRRSEYLYLSGDNRWRRLLINLHPESLFSFFTSRAGVWFVFKICTTIFLLFILAVTFAYFYYRREVPSSVLELQSCIEGQKTEFYDRSAETLLWTLREGSECERVQLDDISPALIDALISVEDKDFFKHPGYKITSIARSVINNLLGRPLQGGSTITQQYIKNTILRDSSRSYERKIKEVVLLPEIESVYSKEEILTAYLNTIYFGSVYSGIEAASQGYFGKPAAELTLDESALLIASISAPNITWNDPELHLKKRNIVLREMLEDGKITQKEHDEALAIDSLAKVLPQEDSTLQEDIIAPYFVLEARNQLQNLLCADPNNDDCANFQLGGHKIITTLDLKVQTLIESSLAETLKIAEANDYNNAGLIVLNNQTREVLGLNGGRDFYHPDFGQVNHLTEKRLPKMTWHPIIYASLLENDPNWGAGRTLYDYETFDFGEEEIEFLGPVTLRQALAKSALTPAAKAAYLTGNQKINQLANDLGLDEIHHCEENCARDHALGESSTIRLDKLSNAYATFASDGQHQSLSYVREAFDSRNQLIFKEKSNSFEALSSQTSFIVNHILSDPSFKPASLRKYSSLALKNRFL